MEKHKIAMADHSCFLPTHTKMYQWVSSYNRSIACYTTGVEVGVLKFTNPCFHTMFYSHSNDNLNIRINVLRVELDSLKERLGELA